LIKKSANAQTTASDDTHRTVVGSECGGHHNQRPQDASRRLELVSSSVRCCECEQCVSDLWCAFLAVSQSHIVRTRSKQTMGSAADCPVLQKNWPLWLWLLQLSFRESLSYMYRSSIQSIYASVDKGAMHESVLPVCNWFGIQDIATR
jgi:hypothetical protein